ncbi:hypothetical protein P3S67_001100 [Capsicum chacoense]
MKIKIRSIISIVQVLVYQVGYMDTLSVDTAKYRPLMKTNFASHTLKYLRLI